jgi:nitrate/nitrite transport system permease protein
MSSQTSTSVEVTVGADAGADATTAPQPTVPTVKATRGKVAASKAGDAPPEFAASVFTLPGLLARVRSVTRAVALGLVGAAAVVALWLVAVAYQPLLPGPSVVLDNLSELLSWAFYSDGAEEVGIAVQLGTSLFRVFAGFAIAACIGIPLGLFMGTSKRAWQAANPVVQVLRPVSPIAWYPIGLVVAQDAPTAAIFVILVTALWPTVLNTASGAASVPYDQRNVARVFQFSKFAYLQHVLLPHTLPSIVTGLRLSMGIGWMVIVAAEALSGGTGIGFFVWDAYNSDKAEEVISAIVLIGLVGLALDMLFLWLQRLVGGTEGER